MTHNNHESLVHMKLLLIFFLKNLAGEPTITEFFPKFDLTKLDVPTIQLSPISQPTSITEFGEIQHPFPIFEFAVGLILTLTFVGIGISIETAPAKEA